MKPNHNYESCPPTNIVDLSTALPSLKDSAVWKKRTEDVRENEWALYQKSLAVLHQALDRILARPFDPITIGELCNLIEVAFALGRRACGLPAQESDKKDPNGDAAFMREVDHMLNKVYGTESNAKATPPPQRSAPIGRDAAPPGSASLVGRDAAPSGSASLTKQSSSADAPVSQPSASSNSNTTTPPDKAAPAAPKSHEGGTEVPHSPKHKPYWLNGHYYANPEYPESVARAMFTNRHQSPGRRGY
jgi:hypothetical protein